MKKMFVLLSIAACLAIVPLTSAAANPSNVINFSPHSLIKSDGTYWVWGNQQAVPTQIHQFFDVQASFKRNIVMLQDGSVWRWSVNLTNGQFDIWPLKGVHNVANVYPLGNRALALDNDGRVYTFPATSDLPNQPAADEIVAVNGINDVIDFGMFYHQTMAKIFLTQDGIVYKDDGTLEHFEAIDQLSGVVAIANNLILKKDGTVWSLSIEHVNEHNDDYTLSIEKVKGLENIREIKSVSNAQLAIDHEDQLWFWGATRTGFSDGTTLHEQETPLRLSKINHAKDAYVIERHLLVLTKDGELFRTSINRESLPQDAEFELIASDVDKVAEGHRHLILQKSDGRLYGWGVNKTANLGSGDAEFMHETPVRMQKPVSISINDEPVQMFNGVVIRNDLAFVPIRSVFEKMDSKLEWDMFEKKATIRQGNSQPTLVIEVDFIANEVRLDGERVDLAHDPFIIQGTSYLPLRFISEALGAHVEWHEDAEHIEIHW